MENWKLLPGSIRWKETETEMKLELGFFRYLQGNGKEHGNVCMIGDLISGMLQGLFLLVLLARGKLVQLLLLMRLRSKSCSTFSR